MSAGLDNGRGRCWSFLSAAVVKTLLPETALWRKGFMWLTFPGHSPSREARAGTQAGACSRNHEGMLFAWLLAFWLTHRLKLSSPFYTTQDHLPRDGATHSGLGLQPSIKSIKTVPRRHAHRPT